MAMQIDEGGSRGGICLENGVEGCENECSGFVDSRKHNKQAR